MKTKLKQTINNQFRVLWSYNKGLRGGYEDFNTEAQAENFRKFIIKNWKTYGKT